MAKIKIDRYLVDDLKGPFSTFVSDGVEYLIDFHNNTMEHLSDIEFEISNMEDCKDDSKDEDGNITDDWTELEQELLDNLKEEYNKWEDDGLVKVSEDMKSTFNYIDFNHLNEYVDLSEIIFRESVFLFMDADQRISVDEDEVDYLMDMWSNTYRHSIRF